MAADFKINVDSISLHADVDLRYLDKENFNSLFQFANDEKLLSKDNVKINTLFKPVLIKYYEDDIAQH